MVLTHLFQMFSLFEASSVSHGCSGTGKLTEGFRDIANLLDSSFCTWALLASCVCISVHTNRGNSRVVAVLHLLGLSGSYTLVARK